MPPVKKSTGSTYNQTPYQDVVSSMQQGTTTGFQGFFPMAPAQAPAKAKDCSAYLKPNYLKLMPYLYQASELAAKEIPEAKRDAFLTKVKVHPGIQEAYHRAAEDAKKKSTETLVGQYVKKDAFKEYGALLEHFFNAATIHSKEAFLETATKGFDWVRPRLAPYGNTWVLMTENYISNVTRAGILKAPPSIPFKSSEWVGKMFLATLDKAYTTRCVVDSTSVRDVMAEPGRSCYVLFDDGAYSGSQKGLILSSFIATVLPVREQTTLYLVIPYYTVYALNRFRMNVNTGIQVLERLGKKVECAYDIQAEAVDAYERYTLTTMVGEKTHRMEIVIWTGGIQMEESERIIERMEGDPVKKLVFLSKMKGVDSLGATMTLFEHKVPDFLSLNAAFGNAFKDKNEMKAHYEYNPPYKVKNLPTGGCGCGRNGGAKRKNYALEGSRTAATMGSGKMSSPLGEIGVNSKRRNR